jgi:hypothetical protein
MPRVFTAKSLTSDQAAQAFPLIQTIAPNLTLERWNEFVQRLIDPTGPVQARRAGIVTLQSERGYIHGLFCYTVEVDLQHGHVLSVENFIALDLIEHEAAVRALFDTMEETAYDLGCHAIHVHLPEGLAAVPENRQWLLRILEGAGHAVETLRLCKHLRPMH